MEANVTMGYNNSVGVFKEEETDVRILATSFMMYKIGKYHNFIVYIFKFM